MVASWQTIIIGATVAACGRAALGSTCLVLEPSCQVGSDFVFSFDSGSDWEAEPVHPWARAFQDRLRAHGILRDGRFQVGRLAPALAGWCLDHGVQVRLLSRVLAREGNRITALTPGGVETFTAATILDTRTPQAGNRVVTALVAHPQDTGIVGPCGPFQLSPGPSAAESYLRFGLPPGTAWPTARAALHRVWLERPPALRAWRLALVGTRFAQIRFANPVQALDAGLRRDAP